MMSSPKLLRISKIPKVSPFQQFVGQHYVGAEHLRTNCIVMAHGTIGFFTDNKTTTNDNSKDIEHIIKDKRKNYVGTQLTIHDNRKICSHAEECVNSLPSVFRKNSRPWIDPDSTGIEEIIDTIRKCPSGALSYSIDGIEYKDPNWREPLVTVSRDGPYLITGGIELIGANIKWGEGASKEHYTLCRCGASNYKPFCDGTHRTINFTDDKN
jgi:uncharacterized Fe-S cluster protein YjdI/CDGSH-type Zn-finger protein